MNTRKTILLLCTALAGTLAYAGDARAADIATDLEALRDAGSDGGTSITAAEAETFAASVEDYCGDEAVLGIVVAHRLRGEGAFASSDAYATLVQGLRYRVEGFAVSQLQAPGLVFRRWSTSQELLVVLDQLGVSYDGVDLVYSWDDWETTGAISLAPQIGGYYAAHIPDAPLDGVMEYAVHLFGSDGRDFWLDNGRELGVYGGSFFLNYVVDLASALVSDDVPTRPAYAQLVHAFTDDASDGGATITGDEFSLLVEQITWEGGPGVEDRRVLRPVLDALYDLDQAGAYFEGDVRANMGRFVRDQILPTATFPGVFWERKPGTHGLLRARMAEDDAVRGTFFYSTDGWNLPHAAECTRASAGDDLVCELGHIPPGAYISYAIALEREDGSVRWIRSTLGNFFHPLPDDRVFD